MIIGINASFLRKPLTGIGQVTVNFLKKLTEFQGSNDKSQNIDSKFILYCQEEPKLDFELPENFQVRVFLPRWKRDDTLRQWLWERKLAIEARQDGCEVFLSLYQSATIFPDSQSLNHVMLVHDLIPKLFPEYLTKWSHRWHYQAILGGIAAANTLLTPSAATKQDLIRELRIASQTIVPIPLGVDAAFAEMLSPAMLSQTLQRYDLAPGYCYHGGGLEVRKNTELVLRAYRQLLDEAGSTAIPPLVISGKVHAATNPLATPVEHLIKELRLQDEVKLIGLVPDADLPALYQGAKLFVFPSRYEGFGLPVLEAMAAGTPVLTTDTGSLKELVSPDTAVVIPRTALSSQALKEAWQKLLWDEKLQATLRERGKKMAQSFTWEQFTQQVMSHLVQ